MQTNNTFLYIRKKEFLLHGKGKLPFPYVYIIFLLHSIFDVTWLFFVDIRSAPEENLFFRTLGAYVHLHQATFATCALGK